MRPIVDGLQEEFDDEVQFVYLNANEEATAAFEQLNLPGHPGFVIYSAEGEEVYRTFSIIAEEQLRDAILIHLPGRE